MAQVVSPQNNVWTSQPIIIAQQQPQTNSRGLQASKARVAMGTAIVALGFILLVLGIASVTTAFGVVGWGIWGGMFGVVTGFVGVLSTKNDCMIIAFLVLAIIASVMSAACCCITALLTLVPHESTTIYILLSVTFGLQMLCCIIGASFSCFGISSRNQPQQVIAFQAHPSPPGCVYPAGVVSFATAQPSANELPSGQQPPPYSFVSPNHI